MTVTGLKSRENNCEVDRYIQEILAMSLPGDNIALSVSVGASFKDPAVFVAAARLAYKGGPKDYEARGDSAEEALLELVAEIIIKYPVEGNERQLEIDINLPVGDIVHTKTFSKWFAMDEKGDN